MPVGNGKIGAMVFGGVEKELIQLNESSLYSGGPVKKNVNTEAITYLPIVREALFNEDYKKANELTRKLQGDFTESYLPLGDLIIEQDFKGKEATFYERALNLKRAVASTKFTIEGVDYTRDVFISSPDQVMVMHLTANKKGALNFKINTSSPLQHQITFDNNNDMLVSGKAPAHVDPSYYNPNDREHIIYKDTTSCNGMRFQYRIRVQNSDGDLQQNKSGLIIKNASEVTLLLTASTSFNGFDKCPDSNGKDEVALTKGAMNTASKKAYGEIKDNHIKDFRKYMDRMSFTLNDTLKSNPNKLLPSNERLKHYSRGSYDPEMETLYFAFGRYLLISCSRVGGPPANLQGIWNKELRAPWSSNYTININTEMNYWPAEVTNLSEMHAPLLDWIGDLSITGTQTAKEFYNAKGWVAHHNSEIWGTSNAVGDKGNTEPIWANFNMGGAWLCQDLWEHYAFNLDKDYLKEKAYPIMKGAAMFCLDILIENKDGYLVTAPSTSPEHKFLGLDGKAYAVSVGSTIDMSIIWDLFTNLIEASKVLDIDEAFRNRLIEKRSKLLPFQIGAKGQLQEWYKDFKDSEPQHRHVSHLFGLHPGKQISPFETPKIFAASKKTLEIRGDEGTGWSKAWKINFWARLLDGNHSYRLLRDLLNYTDQTQGRVHGGTYPNFFDAHPPFQIDGNFGGITGMTEMLLQSHLGDIFILPALPDAWTEGDIKGLKARGNFEIDLSWKDKELQQVLIQSGSGGKCVLRTNVPIRIKEIPDLVSIKSGNYYLTSFQTEQGKKYHVEQNRNN